MNCLNCNYHDILKGFCKNNCEYCKYDGCTENEEPCINCSEDDCKFVPIIRKEDD